MPLRQSIEHARQERVGPQGVAAGAYEDALKRTGEALAWLRARHADGGLPLLQLPERHHELAAIHDAGTRLAANATDIVILGTGGSSLGGQTLAQLAGHAVPGVGALRPPPRLHFMDNLDPESYGALLAKLPLATSRFVAISKSGGTGETLMQTAAALAAVRDAGLAVRIPDIFLGPPSPPKAVRQPAHPVRRVPRRHALTTIRAGGRYFGAHHVAAPGGGAGLTSRPSAPRRAALAPVPRRAPAEVPAAVGAARSRSPPRRSPS